MLNIPDNPVTRLDLHLALRNLALWTAVICGAFAGACVLLIAGVF
jgi:hypothetical protein